MLLQYTPYGGKNLDKQRTRSYQPLLIRLQRRKPSPHCRLLPDRRKRRGALTSEETLEGQGRRVGQFHFEEMCVSFSRAFCERMRKEVSLVQLRRLAIYWTVGIDEEVDAIA